MKAIVISMFVILFACCIASTNPHLNENKSAIVKKESLYGYWSLDGVVWLRITRDRIYFVGEDGQPSVRYTLNKDTITWYFDGIAPQKDIISILNDTLFTRNDEGVGKYVRAR